MSDPTPRLEIRNLRRAYGGRQVVDDVSLQIMPGQVTCLLGPSIKNCFVEKKSLQER